MVYDQCLKDGFQIGLSELEEICGDRCAKKKKVRLK